MRNHANPLLQDAPQQNMRHSKATKEKTPYTTWNQETSSHTEDMPAPMGDTTSIKPHSRLNYLSLIVKMKLPIVNKKISEGLEI